MSPGFDSRLEHSLLYFYPKGLYKWLKPKSWAPKSWAPNSFSNPEVKSPVQTAKTEKRVVPFRKVGRTRRSPPVFSRVSPFWRLFSRTPPLVCLISTWKKIRLVIYAPPSKLMGALIRQRARVCVRVYVCLCLCLIFRHPENFGGGGWVNCSHFVDSGSFLRLVSSERIPHRWSSNNT